MKVKELLAEIRKNSDRYDDFLEWDVYVQAVDKLSKQEQDWEFLKDSEDWDYIKCYGYWGCFKKEKVFTINVDY